ncbi:hypothetical protein LCGC14_1423480 [marine sediment metagenome]|uniref:Uncharacterized protein n=1 Tax=marine sediment metagenome TaxID=412755 RepID=A0A0F9KBR4_9ZZZZ
MTPKNRRLILIIIGLLSIIIVFAVPFGYHIDLGPGPDTLIAMIWEVPLEPAMYSIRYFLIDRIEYSFFRFFFLLEIILLFIGKFNRIRFILVGIISELIPLIISIPASLILNEQGENLITIVWPIPFLLMFDLILVFLVKYLDLNPPKK